MNVNDIVGEKFNKLLVISYSHKEKRNNSMKGYNHFYNCKCNCGNECKVERSSLRFNNTKSCGCIHSEGLTKRNTETSRYGGESNGEHQRILRIYRAMNHRCYNGGDSKYYLYGGRGISVCEEWRKDYYSFKKWALDNGYSDDLSIDRIDVDGNYEPSNCRWATDVQQSNNTRTNKIIEYKDKTQTLAEWCRELELDYFRTKARLNNCNMSIEQAFELPKQILKRKVSE